MKVTGLYGCQCHPFESWDDLKFYEKQKLKHGQIVKRRHTGKFGFIVSKMDFSESFYWIDAFPCEFPSDMEQEHVSCLIPFEKFSEEDLINFKNQIKNVSKFKLNIYESSTAPVGDIK